MTMKYTEMPSKEDDEVRFAAAESNDVNLSASELDDPASLQTLPESTTIQTVPAGDDNVGIITHEILQLLKKEDVDCVETIGHEFVDIEEHSVWIGVKLTATAVHLDIAVLPASDLESANNL